MTITKRLVKGSALTHAEGDANLDHLEALTQVWLFDAGGSASTARPTTINGSAVASTDCVIWVNHGTTIPTFLGTNDIAAGIAFGVSLVNEQTGTSYTLVAGDAGKNVDMNNASANEVTIPTNATVAFPVGTAIAITQEGAGVTTVTGATGVTLNGTSGGSVVLNNRYQGLTLRKKATNTWIAQGDIN